MNLELGTLVAGSLLASLAFGIGAYALHVLNASGALVASLFGLTILLVGGPIWAVPPLAFFVFSSILSQIAKRVRSKDVLEQPRGSRRDLVQVLSNGAVGWLVILVFAVHPAQDLFWVYTGSFAAAAADTWATEIGTAIGGRTISITRFVDVPPGTSGGVSSGGWAATVLGALSVYAASYLVNPPDTLHPTALAVLGGGVLGSAVDSVLGATLQDRVSWISNDTVNVACTVTGALVALVLVY